MPHYPQLCETASADPAQRTEWNVRDSDATLILTDAAGIAASTGSALAQATAVQSGKPFLVVNMGVADAVECVAAWLGVLLAEHTDGAPFKLGIGGSRESEAPGIYRKAFDVIRLVGARLPLGP